ncbi:AzlC family ABC transporter permease [Rothia kristinae]|uniref:AzlC family ABC transporter permease n=1 Tax=Rothia kristinae TaxID=37923 RepID=UPI0021E6189A|nr:AzlC family ABC transporter permease [Rothia kristinae]
MRSVPSSGRPWFPAVAPAQRRECAVIGVTLVAVGLSYGALSQASGFPLWQTVMLAALAIGGAAELSFVGVVAAGGAPILAVLGGLLVNSRNFAFGLGIGEYAPRGVRQYLAAHLANDETAAFARPGADRTERWQRFVLMAVVLFPAWVGGAALGQLLGSVVDADRLGLDAAFPVILFCLVVQDLRSPFLGVTAAGGALLAVAATPVLPLGLGAVASLLALIPAAAFLKARARRRRRPGGGDGSETAGGAA